MRGYGSAVFALVAFTLGASPAAAQEAAAVEVMPYVAIGSSGTAPVGVAITFPAASTVGVETDVAYRRGEGRIHVFSSSASLLWYLPRVGRSTPYVAGGVGLAQYGVPVLSGNGPPVGTLRRVAMTVNAGGGLKTAMTEKTDLRTDVRWSKSLGRYGSDQFRVAQGISFDVGRR